MAFGRKQPPPAYDPWEFGAGRSDPDLASLEPLLPLPPPRFSPKQLLLVFFAFVLVVAVLRDGVGRGTPQLRTSCTGGAFALSDSSLRPDGSLAWTATGPRTSQVVFGLDVKDTTAAPLTAGQGLLAGPDDLPSCRAKGRFGIPKGGGAHVITMFLIAADGTTTTAGSKTVTVDAH